MAQSAMSSGTPIAVSTALRRSLPDEHAAPALTITPARSSAITCVAAGTPGMAMQSVLASRATSAAKTGASGAMAVNRRSA